MAWRFHSRATIDPSNPNGVGACDRCGFFYNLKDLVWQYAYRGDSLQNTRFRVCVQTCLDVPTEQYRPLHLPPDPEPLIQPRPLNLFVDENAP